MKKRSVSKTKAKPESRSAIARASAAGASRQAKAKPAKPQTKPADAKAPAEAKEKKPAKPLSRAEKSAPSAPASKPAAPVKARPATRPARKSPPIYSPASRYDPIQFPEDDAAMPKTWLTAKQLREFKELLVQKRAQLAGDVERLTDEALNRKVRGFGDSSSSMPIHMADLGSDNWEQDFTIGLIANEKALVREIDDALERIANKTYGVCLATHQPIGIARLRAKPWAKHCIEYARAREEGRAP